MTDKTKAPGPDGINAGVLTTLWPEIKMEVLKVFNDFHRDGKLPSGSNSSFIALIPKSPNALHPSQFRPISLMNALLKLLTKVMANRLKPFMPHLVSQHQTAFIKGRQITDGILITSELVALLKNQKTSGLIFKIDFEKAFDRVKWDYVYETLSSMNFGSRWITWIQKLFESSRISVLVNGAPSEEFIPSRGLRQGDPLSPLLFDLVGEGLSTLLMQGIRCDIFRGISIKGVPNQISHLQFADDVILFINNDDSSVVGIKRILQCFQIISGMKVNFTKSQIFGFHAPETQIRRWASVLNCMHGELPFTYLGATIGTSPTSIKFWDPLLLKLKRKLNAFEASNISMAGRLVLLKAALDSTPVYWLSLYKLPVSVANSIERIRRRFLWGESSETHRKLHLIGWDRICKNKQEGGLGIVPVKQRNDVLLAKWWWRAYQERGSYWNKFFVCCYGPKWNYDLGGVDLSVCSPTVRSVLSIRNAGQCTLVSDRTKYRWSCGNGKKVFFWEDIWLSDKPLAECFPILYSKSIMQHSTVNEMLTLLHSSSSEKSLWLSELLPEEQGSYSMLLILTEGIVLQDKTDRLCWVPSGGAFSTIVANKIMFCQSNSSGEHSKSWILIWKLKIPPKISIFLWKMNWGVLPTKHFLSQKLKDLVPLCSWCGQKSETLVHLFMECELAVWAWKYIQLWWSLKHSTIFKFGLCLPYIFKIYKDKFVRRIWQIVVAATLWSIWLARNEFIFNKVKIKKTELQQLIFLRISKWGLASKTILFTHVPLWRVNPVGLIHVQHYLDVSNFWTIRRENFNTVCMVDAAWKMCARGGIRGGIGGVMVNKEGKRFYRFSGPSTAQNIQEAEISAILHALSIIRGSFIDMGKVVLCSDSSIAINAIYEGLDKNFPLLEPDFDVKCLLHGSVCIHFVPSSINEEADGLAKNGIDRQFLWEHWATSFS
ncbi:hypothetical protein DCAR_0933451 [Daucus carota subsp. sativus]|uniref:Reverse transcriptase domain-containing protein n=1 Tax=Daucus carota subsp. sativus TaxID=79200 RepID=A0AAF0XTC5_DAUCS|nr:PREDICTED: uncharacterized protein LOC108201026 [Daucus carota subsp. sativus]WOH13938.1 hypothetical protein DCAR_0933451 [Daucus carota subsp. sativus]